VGSHPIDDITIPTPNAQRNMQSTHQIETIHETDRFAPRQNPEIIEDSQSIETKKNND